MSSVKIKRTFDISKAEFIKDGIVDFYWPLDNKETTHLMNCTYG